MFARKSRISSTQVSSGGQGLALIVVMRAEHIDTGAYSGLDEEVETKFPSITTIFLVNAEA